MKSLINSKAWAMLVVMAVTVSSAMADADDFLLSVRNVTQPTATTIEFDLYLLDTDNAQNFEFAALQMGLLLNSSIYGVGTLTVSYSNTGSGLDITQQFAGSIDVVAPLAGYDGKTLIRLMANSIPPVPPGAGTGTVISSAGNGTFLAHFTITSSVSFTPNTRAGLEFCSGTDVSPLWPTVLYAYIDGNSTPLAVISGVDAIVDGDPVLNPRLPAVYDITGGEPYCAGLGGSLTGLSGSEADATYTVYRNGFPVGTINGTGNPLSFGLQPASTLTVYASNIAGTVEMNGELTIEEIPNNTISLTSGAGSNNQAVCINTAMTDITFSTTGATGIGTSTGLPAGVAASWAANTITISGTPTEPGTFNYSIPLTGGCGTVSATGTITVTANMTAGPASSTPTLCIGTALTNITLTTTGATGIGTPVNLPVGVIASWAADVITISGTPTASGTFSYSIPLTGGCGIVNATGTITVTALPGSAGSITGPATFTPGSSGVAYSVNPISAATTYVWSYSGTGVSINGSGPGVTLDFSASATAGTLSVFGRNSCGDGAAATLSLSPSTKTLTLTSVLLEGLYIGGGTMRQAMGESGPQWPAGIADHITVELHNSATYSTIEFTATDVELTTNGSATIVIPAQHSESYYITIRHRNHIETVSATPVPFTDPSITYSFDDQTQAYGNNLKEIVPGSGYFAIYGGDINHDGYVDSGDYPDVINDSFNYLYGYLNTDLNGDGWVDSGDYPMLVNNSYNYVTIIIPY